MRKFKFPKEKFTKVLAKLNDEDKSKKKDPHDDVCMN
jgi:hypothetical protein